VSVEWIEAIPGSAGQPTLTVHPLVGANLRVVDASGAPLPQIPLSAGHDVIIRWPGWWVHSIEADPAREFLYALAGVPPVGWGEDDSSRFRFVGAAVRGLQTLEPLEYIVSWPGFQQAAGELLLRPILGGLTSTTVELNPTGEAFGTLVARFEPVDLASLHGRRGASAPAELRLKRGEDGEEQSFEVEDLGAPLELSLPVGGYRAQLLSKVRASVEFPPLGGGQDLLVRQRAEPARIAFDLSDCGSIRLHVWRDPYGEYDGTLQLELHESEHPRRLIHEGFRCAPYRIAAVPSGTYWIRITYPSDSSLVSPPDATPFVVERGMEAEVALEVP
jgi:hypothetical protein